MVAKQAARTRCRAPEEVSPIIPDIVQSIRSPSSESDFLFMGDDLAKFERSLDAGRLLRDTFTIAYRS